MKLEWILIFLIVVVVCKPNSGIFRESIVEASEEVSFAKTLESLAIIMAASLKELHRQAIESSPSSNSSDGKHISDSLIPMALCIYIFSHN